MSNSLAEGIPPDAWLRCLDADVAPRHGAARIRLNPDATGGASALGVGVMKRCGTLAFPGLQVGKKDRIVIALHDNLVFKPDAGYERRAGRVVLHGGLVK